MNIYQLVENVSLDESEFLGNSENYISSMVVTAADEQQAREFAQEVSHAAKTQGVSTEDSYIWTKNWLSDCTKLNASGEDSESASLFYIKVGHPLEDPSTYVIGIDGFTKVPTA